MTYTHRVRVRYGECDMQKVVFNAHYWSYCDDAVDCWVRAALAKQTGQADFTELGFDFMLKSASGTWHKPVLFGEEVSVECAVARWGNTSFDVAVRMHVEEDLRFEATLSYVSVGVQSRRPSPVPPVVRAALQS